MGQDDIKQGDAEHTQPQHTEPPHTEPPHTEPPHEPLGEALKDIFEGQPATQNAAPTAAPASAEAEAETELTAERAATELETLEGESPAISERVEVAQDEPEALPEDSAGGLPLISQEYEAAPAAVHSSAAVQTPQNFETGELAEQTYAPTAPSQGHHSGDEVGGYILNEDRGRGWFTASPVGSGPSVDVYTRPALWTALLPHKLLPRWKAEGELTVLEGAHGHPLALPLDAETAKAYLSDLARLLFALEKQGYAVTDLDPDAVQLTAGGIRLRLPPRVARLGETPEPALRDGYTPSEVQEGKPADARSGVYLLGALLYRWLTGHDLPPEGAGTLLLADVPGSAMPQLLTEMLSPLPIRPTPGALLELIKTYSARLPVYQVAARTDIGLNPERPANEDSYGFIWRQIGQHGGGELVLRAVVSDGMGGMAAGEVASQAAVRGFLNSTSDTLEGQIWDANAAVLQDMAGRDGGCTISAVEIRGEGLLLGHVGDTRAYFAHAGQVEQITKDHSYVAAMVASGQMTPEEAQVSPERNKVLRSLGSLRVPQENYVQTLPEPLKLPPGSRVLLVSDGVWGEVEPDILHRVLLEEKTPQDVAERLVALSLEAGAPDNVTALVIERLE